MFTKMEKPDQKFWRDFRMRTTCKSNIGSIYLFLQNKRETALLYIAL